MLVYLRSLQPSGRRSQASALKKVVHALTGGRLGPEQLPWHLLRYEHTSALRDWLEHTHRPGTARAYLASLRGVLKETWRLQWMSTDDYLRAIDLRPISGSTLPRGRHIEMGEVRALFEHLAQDPRPITSRDAAALALLVGAGVRRSELAGLQRADGELLQVADLPTRQLAGHARPDTTASYDRRPDAGRRRAAAMLHVPYVPPADCAIPSPSLAAESGGGGSGCVFTSDSSTTALASAPSQRHARLLTLGSAWSMGGMVIGPPHVCGSRSGHEARSRNSTGSATTRPWRG